MLHDNSHPIVAFCETCHKEISEKRYVDCVICKRFVSVGHTELLFMDAKKEVRVCGWCNHA